MPQVLDMSDGLFEELADVIVVEVVDDLPAVAPADHQPEVTQDAKLMGDSRGLHPNGGGQLVDRAGTGVESSENAQPARRGERLHRLGNRLGKVRVKL